MDESNTTLYWKDVKQLTRMSIEPAWFWLKSVTSVDIGQVIAALLLAPVALCAGTVIFGICSWNIGCGSYQYAKVSTHNFFAKAEEKQSYERLLDEPENNHWISFDVRSRIFG